MKKNLQSISELTEFPPLTPEDKPNFGLLGLSKIFYFGRNTNDEPKAVEEPASLTPSTSSSTDLETLNPQKTFSEGRSLPNILKRISNLVALKNVGLTSLKNRDLKQYWMPDSFSNECYECGEKFTTFRRKHHCRVCGQIFCSRCCNQEIPGKIMGCTGDLRVCTYCCKVVLSYLQSADITADLSADLKALQEDLQVKFGPLVVNKSHEMKKEECVRRKSSVGYQEERFVLGKAPCVTVLSDEERCRALQNSNSLRVLFEEITKPGTGVPLQTHRYRLRSIANCFMGAELVDWLIAHSKAATREQGIAMGQVLLEASYLEAIGDPNFIDGIPLYRPVFYLTSPPSRPSFLESESDDSSLTESHSSYTLNLNVEEITAQCARSSPQKELPKKKASFTDEVDGNVFLAGKTNHDVVLKNGWLNAEKFVRNVYGEAEAFYKLSEAFEAHKESLIGQLLVSKSLNKNWADILDSVSKNIANHVCPDVRNDDEMDIRHYVQIKKLPGGSKEECQIVPGVVCTKNVVHRGMRTHINNPRILLLKCSLIYQRIEGRLLSLEPVLMQEHEYLRHVVARISFLQPDIVMVYRTVSRLAQEYLLNLGITLVIHTKERVLERVARFTGADILTSIDAQISKPQLGTCKSFNIKSFTLEDGNTKTLMFFEGGPFSDVSCTLLLRGGPMQDLVKLKKIASFMVFTQYNWRLEKSFLMDEFAKPPVSRDFLESPASPQEPRDVKVDKLKVKADKREVVRDCSDPLQSAEKNYSENLPLVVEEIPGLNKFRQALDDTVLSMSPFLKVTIPYLESDVGKNCPLRNYFPKAIFYSKQLSNFKLKEEGRKSLIYYEQGISQVKLNPIDPFLTASFTEKATSANIQTMLALFRAIGGQIPYSVTKSRPIVKKLKTIEANEVNQLERRDVLDPMQNQRLPVLFCSYSAYSENYPAFCVDPWVGKMYFYGPDDIPLGCFLEKFCFRSSYACPSQTCHVPMAQHTRRFVHEPGSIYLTLNTLSKPLESGNSILMWSWCTICKEASPMVPMSSDTWCLSFAKYLELRLRADVYRRRATDGCQHSLHHEHSQYFAKESLVARFAYLPIQTRWEISLPPCVILMHSSLSTLNEIKDELRVLAVKGYEVFSTILEKVASFDEEDLTPLKQLHQKEQLAFKGKIEDLQIKLTSPTVENKPTDWMNADHEARTAVWRIEDAMSNLKRTISETVMTWNGRLIEFKKRDDKAKKLSELNLKIASTSSDDSSRFLEDEESLCPQDFLKSVDSETDDNLSISSIIINEEKPGEVQESRPEEQELKLEKKSVKNILSQILPSSKDQTAIQSPWDAQTHVLLPFGATINVIVYESETSSIIAYALASKEYSKFLEERINLISASELSTPSPMNKRKSVSLSAEKDHASELTSPNPHFEMTFTDNASPANFFCCVYFVEEFFTFRSQIFPAGEEAYLRSLMRCVQWAARGGKSGSAFCKTKDDRFVIKEISKIELQKLLEFVPQYIHYVMRCHEAGLPTLLGKILGVYTVNCRSANTSVKSHLLVMENLFCQRNVTDKYDLKGSVRNRLVKPDVCLDEDVVYMDENLLKITCDSPLYVFPHSKTVLMRAIESDTEFLSGQNVMDYSLLVGLEEESSILVVGIIDYLRTFTWDKRFENIVKKSVIMGNTGKQPTIVQPKNYRNRFKAAMERYFLPVPDRWFDLEEYSNK